VHQIPITAVEPVVFDVVDDEGEIWGDPDRLDGAEVYADDSCAWVLVGNCTASVIRPLSWRIRGRPRKRTIDGPDASPCAKIKDLLRVIIYRCEK
jgi:hypothetical protein